MTLNEIKENAIKEFEEKFPRRIYGPVGEPKSEFRTTENLPDKIITFLQTQIDIAWKAGENRGASLEQQFIMNVLDGIDIADEQMNNKNGGTKAIRFALQSRTLPNPTHVSSQTPLSE